MAVVTKYFDPTTGAGAADGSSWANRAPLIVAGAWGSVLTGFDFSGSDSLIALVGPGSCTPTAALSSGSFTRAPTAANQCYLQGCDSSGNALTPPDADWTSDQPAYTYSGFPEIGTTSNIATLNCDYVNSRCINFTATGRTSGAMIIESAAGRVDLSWCRIANSASNTSAGGASVSKVANCLVEMGTTFSYGVTTLGGGHVSNTRLTAGGSGGSGNRDGIVYGGTTSAAIYERCLIKGFAGSGVTSSSSNAGQNFSVISATIVSCGNGIKMAATGSQTANHKVSRCFITGCTVGLDAQSAARFNLGTTRLRNTTDLSNTGNNPITIGVVTTAGSDAEYVDATGGDYRMARSSAYWGGGYGVSDQASGGAVPTGFSGGFQ